MTTTEQATIMIALQITNAYELYSTQITHWSGPVPPPPAREDEAAYEDWEQDYIYARTGVGHEDGDSWYDVTVIASTDPDAIPVGTTYEFGY